MSTVSRINVYLMSASYSNAATHCEPVLLEFHCCCCSLTLWVFLKDCRTKDYKQSNFPWKLLLLKTRAKCELMMLYPYSRLCLSQNNIQILQWPGFKGHLYTGPCLALQLTPCFLAYPSSLLNKLLVGPYSL